MPKYLMQAVSGGVGGDGALKVWSAGAADWAASGFPGPGTAQNVAIQKTIRDDVLLTVGAGSELGRKPEWNGAIWAQRRGWITPDIDLTGVTDATAAIQAALNSRVGVCVQLPDGIIRLNSGLTIPAGATLVGSPRGLNYGNQVIPGALTNVGTLIMAYGTGKLFTMNQVSTVESLLIDYPNQVRTGTSPVVYDYTFSCLQHAASVLNVTALNPYRFLECRAPGIVVDKVAASALSIGIMLGRTGDATHFSRVSFAPTNDQRNQASLIAHVMATGTAYYIDGAELFNFSGCFCIGYNVGINFHDLDADGFKGANGTWVGGGIDLCNANIVVSQPNGLSLSGLRMSAASISPNTAGIGILFTDTSVPGSADQRPGIHLSNVTISGPGSRAVYMLTGYGRFTWVQGLAQGLSADYVRCDTANGLCDLDHIIMPTGATRTGGTGAAVLDTNTRSV